MAYPPSPESRQRSQRYSRMFSAFAGGLFFVLTGLIGWDASRRHAFFRGSHWVDHMVWWQIAVGIGFLALGFYWARLVGDPWTRPVRVLQERLMKRVGFGKTSAAERQQAKRLASGEPNRKQRSL